MDGSTPWFISNGTVQKTDLSADADVLAKKNCIAGNHVCMNLSSLTIFHYQYCFYAEKIKEQNTRT